MLEKQGDSAIFKKRVVEGVKRGVISAVAKRIILTLVLLLFFVGIINAQEEGAGLRDYFGKKQAHQNL